MANALITIAVMILSALAVVLNVFAPSLLVVLAPGFDPGTRDLAVLFTRIMLLQPVLLGLSSILSGMLLAFQRFAAYAAAPVLYNAGILVGAALFVPRVGPVGLAWGVVLGAFFHILVQLPAAARLGFRLRPAILLRHQGVREISHLFLPRLIGLLAGQAGVLVVTFLGSTLVAGSITAYLLAENLQAAPVGLVGISIAVAAFPFLSAAAAQGNDRAFTDTLVRALRVVLFVTLPVSVSLVLLRAQIVRVVLGTGAFDWEDTTATFGVLGILALSVVAQSIIPLLARAFFSLHDTRTPMVVSVLSIFAHIAAAAFLTPRHGVLGLAWAFSGSSLLHFLLLLTVLHDRLGGLQDARLFASAARTGAATVAAVLVVQGPLFVRALFNGFALPPERVPVLLLGIKGLVASLVNMQTFFGVAIQLAASILGGAAAFLLVAYLLHAEELSLLRRMIRRPRAARLSLAVTPAESP